MASTAEHAADAWIVAGSYERFLFGLSWGDPGASPASERVTGAQAPESKREVRQLELPRGYRQPAWLLQERVQRREGRDDRDL